MSKEPRHTQYAIYRIRVRGQLKEDWSDWFDGLAISHEADSQGSMLTILLGPLADQSALHGVLSRLHDLNLELIEAKQVEAYSNCSENDQELRD